MSSNILIITLKQFFTEVQKMKFNSTELINWLSSKKEEEIAGQFILDTQRYETEILNKKFYILKDLILFDNLMHLSEIFKHKSNASLKNRKVIMEYIHNIYIVSCSLTGKELNLDDIKNKKPDLNIETIATQLGIKKNGEIYKIFDKIIKDLPDTLENPMEVIAAITKGDLDDPNLRKTLGTNVEKIKKFVESGEINIEKLEKEMDKLMNKLRKNPMAAPLLAQLK